MTLAERAVEYYLKADRGCAVGILLAANEAYGLGMSEETIGLFEGFRTGMGCGSTCGCLTGAMGVLSRMYGAREDFKSLCAGFVAEFEKAMACHSLDCNVIAAKYKTPERRCAAAAELAARTLESYITRLEAPTADAGHADGTELSAEEIKRVKGMGCLRDKRYPDVFNVRVITRNGKITAQEHRDIAEASERFGSGSVAMTTRLTLEIQGVKYNNIQPLIDFLKARGLDCGGTGSLVRPVVSCKGTTCQYGLCDTYGLSEKIHEKFYLGYRGVTLPHKFKIAVGGCPNNCVKPDLNDLGVVGQKVPVVDPEKCRGCKKCQVQENCPIKIARVEDGKLRIDPAQCNNCGRCAGKCPFGAIERYVTGFKITIGGRWGKKVAHGIPLGKIFTSEEEVLDVIERTILLFRDEGIPGERLSDTVNRLGFGYVEDKLLNQAIDKDAILKKDVTGGATC